MTTHRCGHCRFWAPLIKERNFLGHCLAPARPMDRCTDRTDTCALFEAPAGDNVVRGERIEGFLE